MIEPDLWRGTEIREPLPFLFLNRDGEQSRNEVFSCQSQAFHDAWFTGLKRFARTTSPLASRFNHWKLTTPSAEEGLGNGSGKLELSVWDFAGQCRLEV